MSILVQKAGILDTFQDLGRTGFRRLGINTNGAMDRTSLNAANILLGNMENEAALEMHFPAPFLEFRRQTSFVLSGADFGAQLDGNPIQILKPYTAKRGALLKFSGRFAGNRCYLSVKNGFRLDTWLESDSTNLAAGVGGFQGRRLKMGDTVLLRKPEELKHSFGAGFRSLCSVNAKLRIVRGPAFIDLTAASELSFLNESYSIGADSNRMGFRLEGKPLHLLDVSERISSAVTYGTVQVLPDGQLIMLMADHQTTGGYPNLGTIVGSDLAVAAQLGRNDLVSFIPVSINEAEEARSVLERDFALLRTGIKLRGF